MIGYKNCFINSCTSTSLFICVQSQMHMVKVLLHSNQNKLTGSKRKRGSDNGRIGLAVAVPVVHGSGCHVAVQP